MKFKVYYSKLIIFQEAVELQKWQNC